MLVNIVSCHNWGSHYTLFVKGQTNFLQILYQRRTRTGRCICYKADLVTPLLQPEQRFSCASNCLQADMQDTIYIKQHTTKRSHIKCSSLQEMLKLCK